MWNIVLRWTSPIPQILNPHECQKWGLRICKESYNTVNNQSPWIRTNLSSPSMPTEHVYVKRATLPSILNPLDSQKLSTGLISTTPGNPGLGMASLTLAHDGEHTVNGESNLELWKPQPLSTRFGALLTNAQVTSKCILVYIGHTGWCKATPILTPKLMAHLNTEHTSWCRTTARPFSSQNWWHSLTLSRPDIVIQFPGPSLPRLMAQFRFAFRFSYWCMLSPQPYTRTVPVLGRTVATLRPALARMPWRSAGHRETIN